MTTGPARTKGPQRPSRYPIAVGQRYKIWGEQPGFIYNPYQDQYIPDVEGQQRALQGTGVLPADPAAPKQPGLLEQVGPAAAITLLNSGTKAIGEKLFSGGGGSGFLGDLLGGSSSIATPTVLNGTQVAAAPGGLFSLGQGGLASFNGNGLLGNGPMAGGDYIPGVAGTVGAIDLLRHPKRRGTGVGIGQGAASGAGIGWTLGGPVGAGIGAVTGGLFGAFGGKSRTKVEEERRQALADQGMDISSVPAQAWEQNKTFAQSRNESDLTGKDIIGAANWYQKLGQDWADTSEARRIEIANEALKRGLVRENLGSIDINTDALKDFFHRNQ